MDKIVQLAILARLWVGSSLAQQDGVECVDGLYMIIARGTNEPQGPGDLGRVANRLLDRIESSAIRPVTYPATYTNPYHVDSIKNGSTAAREAIVDYATKCPDGKMALLGYSQGAQVIGNSVCGDTGGRLNDSSNMDHPELRALFEAQDGHYQFEDGPGVDENLVGGKIISVLLFGDPTFSSETSFSEGDATGAGLWPRDWASCDQYSALMRSYCDDGDIICDAGSDFTEGVHEQYVQRYGRDAVQFVLERWNEVTGEGATVSAGGSFAQYNGTESVAGNSSVSTTTTAAVQTSLRLPSSTKAIESVPTAGAPVLHPGGCLLVVVALMALTTL